MPWANGEFRNTSGKGRVRDPETDKRIAKSKPLPAIDNTYAPGEDLDTFEFLKRNPAFIDKPATIEQFIDEERYLGLGDGIRPAVRQALVDIFGETVSPHRIAEKRYGIFTGAIGIGKSTLASIAMPYMAHWVLCLHNPQKYFNLLKGRRIAFMLMSTTDAQAKEVLFGDIKANVDDSPWFLENAPRDQNFKNQIRFPKDVWIIPGNSQDTKFEGYNILGGAIDEADSHKQTADKDYAQSGYNTIENRITSRFGKAGLLLVIGQMKTSNGFASRTYKRMLQREDSAAVKLTLWESFGWQKYRKPDGTYDVFWFDIKRKEEVSAAMARDLKSQDIIPIPNEFKEDFDTNPVKALRDLAGIPPDAEDPFIAVYERVESAMLRWHDHHPDIEQPVNDSCINPAFHPLLFPSEPQKRVLHVDIAYSDAETADALGMAMGYVDKLVDIDGDWKPYIVYDFLLRVKARTGTQIMLADIRRLIYELIDERGYRIGSVTVDGTQSLDMIQTLQKRRINASYMSVDKIRTPFEDLRETIYERRCEFPAYVTELSPGTAEMVVIAAQELKQLEDTGKKIDHPPHGSKDVADAMAAVAYILHGSPQYRRGVARAAANRRAAREEAVSTMGPGYDENLADAVTPIDVDFYDETGELMRALGGLSGPRPTVPKGLPPLRDDPFGHIMLPSRNI